VAAAGKIIAVNLDDTGVDIVVAWETSEMTISADGDSLQAALVRKAATDVVDASHTSGTGTSLASHNRETRRTKA
jgi:hypothetical protein